MWCSMKFGSNVLGVQNVNFDFWIEGLFVLISCLIKIQSLSYKMRAFGICEESPHWCEYVAYMILFLFSTHI